MFPQKNGFAPKRKQFIHQSSIPLKSSHTLSFKRFDKSLEISIYTVTVNTLWLVFGMSLAQVLMAVSVLLTAKQLGNTQFGGYAACFSAASLSSLLFNLGLDTWLLRNGSHEPGKIVNLLRNAFTVKVVAGLLWLAGIVLILPQLHYSTFSELLVFVSALCVWAEGVFSLGLSVFRALLYNKLTALLLIVMRGGILLATLFGVRAGIQNALAYAEMRLAVTAACTGVTILLLPLKSNIITIKELISTVKESLPFALSDLFASIYVQADTTIIALTLGKEAVGLYAPASSLINALFVIPNAGFLVAVPILTRTIKTNGQLSGQLLKLIAIAFPGIGIILWVFVKNFSKLMPIVFGPSYSESAPLLEILSPILFLKSCSFAAAAVLVAIGWQHQRAYIQAITAVVNLMLNFLAVYCFGVRGVAMVYVISEIFLLVGYIVLIIWWIRKKCNISSTPE
jgi:O-antigen/teichoic acid export membrane protein